jgi:multiple sugar transport system substrate-binding protein
MYPGALEALRVQGVQWGIPAGLDFVVAYYNAQRFKIAGATPPTPDWTQDDFLAAAVAVHHTEGAATRDDFAYGFCSVPDSADPIYLTYLFGGRLFDRLPDPTRPMLDDPANVEAVQWYTDLRLEYGVTPDPDEIRKYFPRGRVFEAVVRGKCGLWFGQYSDRGGRTWPAGWQGEGVMLPLPRYRAPFSAIQVDGYYLLSQSRHRQEAWEWIRFLLDHQEAAGLMLPPVQSQARSEEYAIRVGEDIAAVARQLPRSAIIFPTGADPILGQTVELYLGAITKVLKGDVDVEAALSEAQAQAEALFSARE